MDDQIPAFVTLHYGGQASVVVSDPCALLEWSVS